MHSRVLGSSRRRGPYGLLGAHVVSVSLSLIKLIFVWHIFAAAPRRCIAAVRGPAAATSSVTPPATLRGPTHKQRLTKKEA